MSDDKTAILIRALEASGSEREANLARAILGNPAPPDAQQPPAAAPTDGAEIYRRIGAEDEAKALEARRVEAAAQAAALPEGLMSVAEVEAHERNPNAGGLKHAERVELADRYIRSCEYHMKNGSLD